VIKVGGGISGVKTSTMDESKRKTQLGRRADERQDVVSLGGKEKVRETFMRGAEEENAMRACGGKGTDKKG